MHCKKYKYTVYMNYIYINLINCILQFLLSIYTDLNKSWTSSIEPKLCDAYRMIFFKPTLQLHSQVILIRNTSLEIFSK
ncbi:hypothetical protein V1477_000603 [Vespula maculifrons]|uniref:Uncharacterized protein n=1 Tax=Vespula maculifrons TaxID=7453 RepID=A0ABD2D223_VESMC